MKHGGTICCFNLFEKKSFSIRHMPVEEKQPFLDMAESLKRQHHLDHPDYKFKPKQRSTIGNKTTIKKNSSLTRLIYLRNLKFICLFINFL